MFCFLWLHVILKFYRILLDSSITPNHARIRDPYRIDVCPVVNSNLEYVHMRGEINSNRYDILFRLKISFRCSVSSLLVFTWTEAKRNSKRYGFHIIHFDRNEISNLNQFHNILRLVDVFPNFSFITSETMGDYYL